MGYILPSFSPGKLFCRISRLQCIRFSGKTRVLNESIQFSQSHPPPYTFINLHTPPLTFIYPYSLSFSFIYLHQLHQPIYTLRHPHRLPFSFLKSSAQGTQFMLCRNLTSRRLNTTSTFTDSQTPSSHPHLPLQTFKKPLTPSTL